MILAKCNCLGQVDWEFNGLVSKKGNDRSKVEDLCKIHIRCHEAPRRSATVCPCWRLP
jgi:hypothetical protein